MSQRVPLDYGFAGDSKYGRYYRHSGQLNLSGVFAALSAGMVVGAVLGVVYSATVIFVPFVKLRGLACVFYGIGMGAAPAVLLKKLKVRNLPISLAVVGVATLLSFYISWASWEAIVLRDWSRAPSFVELVANPVEVVRLAEVINEGGTWSIGGSTYSPNVTTNTNEKGTFLLIIWIIEAATIFGGALTTVKVMLHQLPFCEKCNQWCAGPKLVRTTASTDAKLLKSKLEAGDFAYVSGLPAPAGGESFEFNRHRCEKCQELNTLSVLSRSIKKDKKGKIRGNTKKTIINKLLVSGEDLGKLLPATPPIAAVAPRPAAAAPTRKPLKSPQSLQ